ncbi:2-dehydro-3-deoxygalactonokinase [Halomonas sp. LS-001]
MPVKPAWVAVDWGSSNLRAWGLDTQGKVIAKAHSQRGMLSLAGPETFEQALLDILQDWLCSDPSASVIKVVICGMAGARQGWKEAPYLALDDTQTHLGDQLAQQLVKVEVQDPRLSVSIIPGLCQSTPHYDVMRGEETQLVGLLAQQPDFTGTICLPGTHTKWVRLNAGRIEHFATVMSGELFALLSQSSVLKHSLTTDNLDHPDQRACFVQGVKTAIARPAELNRELFTLRAQDLLDPELPTDESRKPFLGARLSGLLLGLELAGHALALPEHEPIVLIGNAHLCRRYQLAFDCLADSPQAQTYTDMTLAGLTHIYQPDKA